MKNTYPHATCGAKTRAGHPCRSYPMKNGRCRMHGGVVRPRTPEGEARRVAAITKHGRETRAKRTFRRQINAELNRIIALGEAAGLYRG